MAIDRDNLCDFFMYELLEEEEERERRRKAAEQEVRKGKDSDTDDANDE